MSSDVAISVNNLSKCYQIYEKPQDRLFQMLSRGKKQYFKEFWALKDISFEIQKGETFGIIGRNGSGKSTLLQILAGTLAQTSGAVTVNGRIAALLELGSGFNPDFTGRENVFLNGSILGLTKQEITDRYDRIVDFADIGEFIDQPVKTYSSGMFVRLAFAVQAHIDASIVIIDEALAVGDVFFRQKCYGRLEELRSSGAAILLVSHSMPDIEQYCKRAILLDNGHQKFIGEAPEASKHYYLLHQEKYKLNSSYSESLPPSAPLKKNNKDVLNRPPIEAYIDLANKSQISNGQARCSGVALTNTSGETCNSFRQGETLVLHYDFLLKSFIEVPICGAVISNDKGIIVHGKNNWEADVMLETPLYPGDTFSCKQEIVLDIAPGDYVIEVGFASISMTDFEKFSTLSNEEFNARENRICHVPKAAQFSVGLASRGNTYFLKHHGIADLPSQLKLSALSHNSQTKNG
ncbi:ABC transporter ATP-binding protein [Phormidium tenue]|uniref:ABC transporter ATP-binding protein n=1 Tax=Phormidium tenue NIES-30 TaxID=549789 RepID=A0A1U7J667_9CYAN|nr:ABC transporter ATP-binding protein [Phormidium tenue]MBD2232052.1 ABC transporter ATP-binding protein [Phormidium tenue FACHB-1052]OKH48359.1 ABC transporter ATP-binding protein [Phormidium tenue NIES-30]